jgi:heme/copper-type cytochrome/quinol oxidase subunit 2
MKKTIKKLYKKKNKSKLRNPKTKRIFQRILVVTVILLAILFAYLLISYRSPSNTIVETDNGVLYSLSRIKDQIFMQIVINKLFNLGEFLEFEYMISTEKERTVKYRLAINCRDFNFSSEIKESEIKLGYPIIETYKTIVIDKSIKTQKCVAIFELIHPQKEILKKEFDINTDSEIGIKTLFCEDLNCSKPNIQFLKNKEVFISFVSDVKDINYLAVLTYPNSTSNEITLPVKIITDLEGYYTLNLNVYKKDFRNSSEISSFEVLGQLDGPEIPKGDFEKKNKSYYKIINLLLLIVLVFIIILILVYIIVRKIRSKKIVERLHGRDMPYQIYYWKNKKF